MQVKKYPTSYTGELYSGIWTNISRLYTEDGSYAGCSSAFQSVGLYLGGFDFSDIPNGSFINSIAIETKGYRTNVANQIPFYICYNGTMRGQSMNIDLTDYLNTPHVFQNTNCGSWSVQELKSGLLSVYLNPKTTYSEWDYVAVVIDYTPFDYKPFGQII